MNQTSLANAVKNFTQFLMGEIHTAIPAQIEKYDSTSQKAEVLPLLHKKYKDGTDVEYPKIVNVPVVMPRTASAGIFLPVEKGDTVLLIFSERSLDDWLVKGGSVSTPADRHFDLSDAIAIIGLFPFNKTNTASGDDIEVIYGDSSLAIRKNGDIEITDGKGSGKLSGGSWNFNNGNLTVD